MLNQELIVPSNKEQTKMVLVMLPFLIGALCYFLYLSLDLSSIFGHYISFFIQSILIFSILLFVIGFVFAIFLSNSDIPAARLNHEGIWVRYYNFIPWSEISDFDYYSCPGTPIVGIGIRVKDIKALSKESSIQGKLGIFWSKVFGYPPIILSNIAMDNEQIIVYAKRFIKNNLDEERTSY